VAKSHTVVLILLGATALAAAGLEPQSSTHPWPPGVQAVSTGPDSAPPLSPADAMKTFYMPPGYHVELVASEPLVQDPVAMDWDASGRLWVVEMPGFVQDLATVEPNPAPIGRVVVLEDTNHDGTMDKRTVFADGLVLARAIKVTEHGVLVGEPPYVWLMRDTDGDLHVDTKEQLTDDYGRREGRVEENASSLFWAMDNRIYTSNSDVEFHFANGTFTAEPTLSRGEWGVTEDDAGHIYRNSNESALHVDLVPTQYFARNAALLRTRGSYETLNSADGEINTVWPVRPTPGTNRAYQQGIDRPDGSLVRFTSACGPMVYRGDRLPPDLYGNAFVAEPAANLVSRIVISDDGSGLQARKAYPQGEFLASTDERFRPVFISNAPDGTLYIVDMYRGIIQQRADVTEYLRDQILGRKLEHPTGLGRIYRVVYDGLSRDTTVPALSNAPVTALVQALTHPNGWWRDTAERVLVERGDRSAVAPLTTLARTANESRTRVQALWTLDGMDAIDPDVVVHALADPSRDVRATALRIAERWLGDDSHPAVRSAVLALTSDNDWAVRDQLGATLGTLPAAARATAVAAFLEHHADDPVALDAALSSISGSETATLDALLATSEETPQRADAIAAVAATIVRGDDSVIAAHVLDGAASASRPAWQRSALLRGAEVALIGAPMPGTPAAVGRRTAAGPAAGATPCPTCPGGRAGPGGAYAYSTPSLNRVGGVTGGPAGAARAATAGRGRAGGAGRSLQLTSEPASFVALASNGGDLAPRATRVLTRIVWPGKAGAPAPVAALTADEQRRFDAGRTVYQNICQACHQPDGRGQEKVAASLVGSTLALGPADVTARILLNGKEGSIGLMPPVGQVLNDEQIADVLTYVRREWGQTGSPVDPSTIASVRAQTAGRARPWTNDELLALAARERSAQ
jgi:mono/diheme cytochrome c family protein